MVFTIEWCLRVQQEALVAEKEDAGEIVVPSSSCGNERWISCLTGSQTIYQYANVMTVNKVVDNVSILYSNGSNNTTVHAAMTFFIIIVAQRLGNFPKSSIMTPVFSA